MPSPPLRKVGTPQGPYYYDKAAERALVTVETTAVYGYTKISRYVEGRAYDHLTGFDSWYLVPLPGGAGLITVETRKGYRIVGVMTPAAIMEYSVSHGDLPIFTWTLDR